MAVIQVYHSALSLKRSVIACVALLNVFKRSITYPGSVIVRTAAEGIAECEIAQDMAYLAKLWEYIQRKQRSIVVPSLIFEELPLPQRVIRDLANEDTAKNSGRFTRSTWQIARVCPRFCTEYAKSLIALSR